ncbi:hypothetical protein CBL_12092 [Carabus blaptoides fortunei]
MVPQYTKKHEQTTNLSKQDTKISNKWQQVPKNNKTTRRCEQGITRSTASPGSDQDNFKCTKHRTTSTTRSTASPSSDQDNLKGTKHRTTGITRSTASPSSD